MDNNIENENVITVRGCVDFSNSKELCDALTCAVQDGGRIVIDLSQAGMLDSSVLGHLLAAHGQAQAKGIEMTMLGASNEVKRILQMGGVATAFGLPPLALETQPPEDKSSLLRQDWRITESVILAEPELAVCLRDLAVDAAVEAGLDDTGVRDVRLAVTEALANALVHGSPEPGRSKITLRCLACPHAFLIEVIDEGPGMPSDGPGTDSSGHQDIETDGGLGLRLIERAMDEVEYFRVKNGSYVRMVKWIRTTDEQLVIMDC